MARSEKRNYAFNNHTSEKNYTTYSNFITADVTTH